MWLLVALALLAVAPRGVGATCTAYETVVTGDSPLYYWRLNENSKTDGSTATDTQGNNSLTYYTSGIGTVTGPVTNTTDTDAADWGTGDNQRYATSATSLSMTGSWTIEMWLKVGEYVNAYIMDHGDSPAVVMQYGYNGVWLYSASSACNNASKIPLTDTASWHHLVWTWNDSTDVLTAYLDGSSVNSGSSLNCNMGDTVFYLGNFRDHTAGADYHGKMDEVSIYQSALSSTKVADHYAAATCVEATATQTPTITPTPTITETPTITPTPTITNTPTITPEFSHTPTITTTPTITATPRPRVRSAPIGFWWPTWTRRTA